MADRELTEDEVADLKEAFAMFDINGDGRLIFSTMPRNGRVHVCPTVVDVRLRSSHYADVMLCFD